jgi:hypothetical protein
VRVGVTDVQRGAKTSALCDEQVRRSRPCHWTEVKFSKDFLRNNYWNSLREEIPKVRFCKADMLSSSLFFNVFVPMIMKTLMCFKVIKIYQCKYNSVTRTIFLIPRFHCSNAKIPNAERSEIKNAHFCILVPTNLLTYCYHHHWKPTYIAGWTKSVPGECWSHPHSKVHSVTEKTHSCQP